MRADGKQSSSVLNKNNTNSHAERFHSTDRKPVGNSQNKHISRIEKLNKAKESVKLTKH